MNAIRSATCQVEFDAESQCLKILSLGLQMHHSMDCFDNTRTRTGKRSEIDMRRCIQKVKPLTRVKERGTREVLTADCRSIDLWTQ